MRKRLAVLGFLLCAAVVGSASVRPAMGQIQVKDLDPGVPRLPGPGEEGFQGAPGITWGIAAAASLGVIAIAFKTSKRTHLD